MDFSNVINEISEFCKMNKPNFSGGGEITVKKLEKQFQQIFPQELKEYISSVLPENSFSLSSVGNDICIYGYNQLSILQEGYNYNPITNEPIEGWNPDWFLIGDQGGDPIIVDLSVLDSNSNQCSVFQAIHGDEEWNFVQISSSIPQFLLIVTYMHHSMIGFDIDEVIVDEKHKFTLIDEVANWLFPRIKECDPDFYSEWVEIFDNA